MVRLSWANLPKIDAGVRRPHYDRSTLTPGILHIGCGNFHRAHQGWYIEQLLGRREGTDWAIIGAGVRPQDAAMREKLAAQDFLTTLVELSPTGKRAEITGSMIDFVPVQEGNAALIAAMSNPGIRIVSLTVTEGGYFVDPATGAFRDDHADIQHDVRNPQVPRTAFGAMIAALRLRREHGVGPFTGLSCDNLQGNGDALKRAVVSLARLSDAGHADWIERECTFPNSMVDCIVPNTGPKELELARGFGIDDAAPVTHEPFRMWVIEDAFCAGRPPLEKVGAIFTDRVHPYEMAKIRILNGGGQVLGAVGELLGHTFVADAMSDPDIHAYFRKCEEEEILPLVADLPGYTAAAYLDLVEERFSNKAMADTTRRFAHDGSSRQPGFLLPSVRDSLARQGSVEGLALASALWCRYCLGIREDGSQIEPNDPMWDLLVDQASAASQDPLKWLSLHQIYGDLGANDLFVASFMRWMHLIQGSGVRATLRQYVVATP